MTDTAEIWILITAYSTSFVNWVTSLDPHFESITPSKFEEEDTKARKDNIIELMEMEQLALEHNQWKRGW